MTYQSTTHQIDTNSSPDYDSDIPSTEESTKHTEVRKRIDELLEKKRLKELLDESDDWDI